MAEDTVTTYGPGGIDPSKPDNNVVATAAVPVSPEEENRRAIEAAARQAFSTNRAYLALSSPTAAQTTAEVKALAKQMNGVLRLVLGQFDGTD